MMIPLSESEVLVLGLAGLPLELEDDSRGLIPRLLLSTLPDGVRHSALLPE